MEITITFTEEEVEELLHATIGSYMEYDERMFHDATLQAEYNKGVEKYNNTIDNLRIKLKKGLEDAKAQ